MNALHFDRSLRLLTDARPVGSRPAGRLTTSRIKAWLRLFVNAPVTRHRKC